VSKFCVCFIALCAECIADAAMEFTNSLPGPNNTPIESQLQRFEQELFTYLGALDGRLTGQLAQLTTLGTQLDEIKAAQERMVTNGRIMKWNQRHHARQIVRPLLKHVSSFCCRKT
jgi:hypothetical protein